MVGLLVEINPSTKMQVAARLVDDNQDMTPNNNPGQGNLFNWCVPPVHPEDSGLQGGSFKGQCPGHVDQHRPGSGRPV